MYFEDYEFNSFPMIGNKNVETLNNLRTIKVKEAAPFTFSLR